MLKRLLLCVLLVLLYLVIFAAGSFLHPFSVTSVLASRGRAARIFIWDGVLFALALYLLTLGIEAAGKRLRDLASWTTGSLIVALVLGYLLRLGFVTREF